MRLDVGSFPVSRAEIGARTSYAGGLLTVGHEAVRRLVLRDPRIRDVTLELVHPGDSVRVLRALDAIEPLVKVRGPGSAFPGFNGPPVTGGSGGSHRLEGFAVVEVTDFPFPAAGVQAFEEGIVEMSGPGAAYSGCADRVCLCLVLTPGSAYYVTCGNHGILSQMAQHAREIAADLRAQNVDAVLLVAT